MKTLTGCLLLLAAALFAQEPSSVPWTPVGVWRAEHTGWSGLVVINADGSFYRKTSGQMGKWFLFSDGRQVSLVLAWNKFGAEPLVMVDSDEFHADYSYGPFTLKREPQPQADNEQSVATPAGFRQSYLDGLQQSLLREVEKDNFGVAKSIAAEIRKASAISPASPDLAPCGIWGWDGGGLVVICPGGSAFNGHARSQWSWMDPKARTFQIKWPSEFIDDATLSEDGAVLSIKNNKGQTFQAHRLPNFRVEDAAGNKGAAIDVIHFFGFGRPQ